MAIRLVAEVACLVRHVPLASILHILPYKGASLRHVVQHTGKNSVEEYISRFLKTSQFNDLYGFTWLYYKKENFLILCVPLHITVSQTTHKVIPIFYKSFLNLKPNHTKSYHFLHSEKKSWFGICKHANQLLGLQWSYMLCCWNVLHFNKHECMASIKHFTVESRNKCNPMSMYEWVSMYSKIELFLIVYIILYL